MYPYIRLLHWDVRMGCELHLVHNGETLDTDDEYRYVGTFRNAQDASKRAAEILPHVPCVYSK